MIRPADWALLGLRVPGAAAMSPDDRTPCDRLIARKRRERIIAWCLFLALIAGIVVAKALMR